AVDELPEAGMDERPAGRILVGAIPARAAVPGRVEHGPVEQRRHDEPQEPEGGDGQRPVEPGREQVAADPSRRPVQRSRERGSAAVLGDEGAAHRSNWATRRWYQFISADTARLMNR